MNTYNKELGKRGEIIARKHYEDKGYSTIKTNYTAKGHGEIDIIASKDKELIFIEVKTVDHTNDLHEYITATKLKNLNRAINHYLYHYPTDKLIRLDVAFVQNNTILDVYENITNN